eukprot:CAMPEP_0177545062 /NCGR_PEP_ID=MMETSP0369-20130122/62359_1 /TAXON_ID=447022 ORGANISM="Scrippsiella hangoei-like, Strain SHHI-4" /NCGR_SAMPLE_ID=MMETSP0369 /ASSEMBLY_ACC=CAM_ASM_000364 /LENGTH=43 /DNA_ID= /DNA_START= /DNA_END= /DNA_ORIENTATION=
MALPEQPGLAELPVVPMESELKPVWAPWLPFLTNLLIAWLWWA